MNDAADIRHQWKNDQNRKNKNRMIAFNWFIINDYK